LFELYKVNRIDKSQTCRKAGAQSYGSKAAQTAMTARLPKTSYQDFERSINAKDLDAQMKEFFMASRFNTAQFKNKIFATVLASILVCVFALPSQAYAKDIPNTLPTLNTFIATVTNGNASALRGVYVANVMALTIVQQPVGYPGYVSSEDSVATQFSIATEVGNVGLLAHNTRAGSFFSKIKQDDRIILVYGDGHIQSFMASSIQRYQALSPLSPYSEFKDQSTLITYSAEQLFNNVYRGKYHLTLQTCIENNGNSSWGRLFIVAIPVENENNIQENILPSGKTSDNSGLFTNKGGA
jgi:hypothetical protein